jgi:signal transduction histidine kinase
MLVVLAAVVIAVGGLVAGFNLVLGATLDHNARDLVRSRAVAQLASLRVDNGRLELGESPDDRAADAYVWVYSGARALDRPSAAPAVQDVVDGLVGKRSRFVTVPATDTLLYTAPIVHDGTRLGTVMAGVSLAPYEETRRTALIASLVLGGLVVVVLGFVVWWLLGAALRPVVRMTRQAADWSERDLDHRFVLGSAHDELAELGSTLNQLLDRLAASLRRERRFSAELSHELRTPLAGLLAESEVALRRVRTPDEYREALHQIHADAAQLSRLVDSLVAAARYEAGSSHGTADADEVAASAATAVASLAAERGIELDVLPSARRQRIGVDADLAERILQPVVENACRYGKSRVRIAVDSDGGGAVLYRIEDDGTGVRDDEHESIFEPGVRGAAAAVNGERGAGLGLSLARRLARTVDGDVVVEVGETSSFAIRLPAG